MHYAYNSVLWHYYMHYGYYITYLWLWHPLQMAVVPDDDNGLHNADEEAPRSPRSQTPPTPPVQDEPSPPPSPRPLRQRAMAQLRPVSIPNVVCFTLIALKTSISPSYPQTEVILMCMEHCWMIRYMNTSYSEHWYVILWTRPDTFGSMNY
jgi:hypothetical protein